MTRARRKRTKARWERNRSRGQYGAFIARYPKRCWYCAEETEGTECAFAEDDVLVHTRCLILMDPDARIYDKLGNRIEP
jgi:hypothetical protein